MNALTLKYFRRNGMLEVGQTSFMSGFLKVSTKRYLFILCISSVRIFTLQAKPGWPSLVSPRIVMGIQESKIELGAKDFSSFFP